MLLCAGAVRVQNEQHYGLRTPAEARRRRGYSEGAGAVLLDVSRDRRQIPWMPRAQTVQGCAAQRLGIGSETDLAAMPHERISCQEMLPTASSGTQAEVVLFSVASSKRILVELPDLVEGYPGDEHAEADTRWQLSGATQVGDPERLMKGLDGLSIWDDAEAPGPG